jgi:hypothetical protein
MTFNEFSDSEIEMIRNQLAEEIARRGMQIDEILVSQCVRTGLLDISAVALTDPYLETSGNWAHRRIRFEVTVFTDSEETECEVLCGRVEYSVDREHSNFFPVLEEYGERVTIVFGWEFDRNTLEHRAASVTDRDMLHYVSVLPNQDFIDFIRCCSEVVEQWA